MEELVRFVRFVRGLDGVGEQYVVGVSCVWC
jgi:hypothetical protein